MQEPYTPTPGPEQCGLGGGGASGERRRSMIRAFTTKQFAIDAEYYWPNTPVT